MDTGKGGLVNKNLIIGILIGVVVALVIVMMMDRGGGGGGPVMQNQAPVAAGSGPLPDMTQQQAAAAAAGIVASRETADVVVSTDEKKTKMSIEGNFTPAEGWDKVSASDCNAYMNYPNPAGGAALRTESIKALFKDNTMLVYFKIEGMGYRLGTLKVECKSGDVYALVLTKDIEQSMIK